MLYSSNKWLPMERVTFTIGTIESPYGSGKCYEKHLIYSLRYLNEAATVGTHTVVCQSAHWCRQLRTGRAVACYECCHLVSPIGWILWLILNSNVSESKITTDSSLLSVSPRTTMWEKQSFFTANLLLWQKWWQHPVMFFLFINCYTTPNKNKVD